MTTQPTAPSRPPTTRNVRTHRVCVGPVTAYITVNRNAAGEIIEVFAKADEGVQGNIDMACRLASLAIQGRGDVPTLIRHMRGDRTEPCGIAGQPSSVYDAIARVLESESEHGEPA